MDHYEGGSHGPPSGYGPGRNPRSGYSAGRGRYVRSRPVKLRTIAAITGAQWIGRRLATRVTPIFLVLLLIFGLPIAFLSDPWTILTIGAGFTIVFYAVNRHVSRVDKVARQWALRMTALPVTSTAWVMLWWGMHKHGWLGGNVVSKPMILTYFFFGCLIWSWLYVAKFVGLKVAWERTQRDFAPIAERTGLAGATVVKTVKTAVGKRTIIDVRGTGQTPAQILKAGNVGELMAGHEELAPGTVHVQPSASHAGYIEVSTWLTNPWAKPIPHPQAPTFTCAPVVSPVGRFPVGKDPETDKLLHLEIVNDDGGMHWVVIAGTRGGKTNLLNNVVEYMTRALDRQGRPLVRITMIDILKGHKDAANWAPAVHRVHAGREGIPGALASLQQAVNLIGERSRLNGARGRSKHVPTADEPIELIIIDEASFLLDTRTREGQRAIGLVNDVLKGGASELVLMMIAAQRGVLAHLGSGDVKANAFGVCVLPVKRPIEQTNIIADWRERGMPDMSKYGQGAKGTILIVVNDEWTAGRTYELWQISDVRTAALARVLPEHEAMAAASGAPYALVGSGAPVSVPAGRADVLLSEPPADGVDGPDRADDLDFDTGLDASVRTPSGHPDTQPDGLDLLVAFGPGAEDDEAVEAAVEAAGHPDVLSNVRPIHPDVPPWVSVEDIGEDDEDDDEEEAVMPEIDDMTEAVDRMVDVTASAAAKEQDRTSGERAELVRLWREHTASEDQGTGLPDVVNAALSALARSRGAEGFTLREARESLEAVDAVDSRTSTARFLRVLTNQGHLRRRPRAGTGGADLYLLNQRKEA